VATQRPGSDGARALPNRPAGWPPADAAPLRPTSYYRASRPVRRPPPRPPRPPRRRAPHRFLRLYTVVIAVVAGGAVVLGLNARDSVARASRRDAATRADALAWRQTAAQLLRHDRVLERRLAALTRRYARVASDLRAARAASAAAAAAAAAPPPAPVQVAPVAATLPPAPAPAPVAAPAPSSSTS
jgi:hypothetical protein